MTKCDNSSFKKKYANACEKSFNKSQHKLTYLFIYIDKDFDFIVFDAWGKLGDVNVAFGVHYKRYKFDTWRESTMHGMNLKEKKKHIYIHKKNKKIKKIKRSREIIKLPEGVYNTNEELVPPFFYSYQWSAKTLWPRGALIEINSLAPWYRSCRFCFFHHSKTFILYINFYFIYFLFFFSFYLLLLQHDRYIHRFAVTLLLSFK